MKKDKLRKEYRSIRDNIPNKDEKSLKITKKLIEEKSYKEAKIIALYSSINSEVDTNFLAKICIKDHKIIAYPKVINESKMLFYKVNKLDELEIGHFNIKEPIVNEKNLISKENIDLIIIPGLCFDKFKNRIGYGKGYYDDYLKDSKILKVGICFESQITKEKIETNPNDIKMDYIITEENIYK